MPVYEYKAKSKGCDYCKDGFEIAQKMSEKALTKCPKCSASVRKVFSKFTVSKGDILSTSNLKDKGFTRLRKVDKGTYEKDV